MHRVNRIEIELHSGEPALARALSERVGRIHRERIAPVVDRVCTELSGDEAVVRIDRLELDLGTVAADDLEDAFVARLELALRAALAKALRRTAGDQRVRASLELLETFALTGSLPWWAPHDREVVAHHFARAAVEAGADLKAFLRRIAHDPGALDRIARMCGGHEPIGNPSAARASPPAGRGGERDARRRPDPGDGARSPRQSAGDEAMVQPPSASSRLTGDTSRRQPPADPDALDEQQAPAQDTDSDAGARSADQPGGDEAMDQRPSAATHPTGDVLRRRPPTDPATLDERQARAQGTAPGDGARATEQHGGDEVTEQRPSAASRLTEDTSRRQSPDAPTPPERRPPMPPVLAALLATSPRMAAGAPRRPPVPAAPAAIRAARRGALARLDELYVADAGLVILWPFLEPFFLRTGVLGDDRRFFDEVAQLQAVALVESLATADPAPLEFHLPLAKLLCGRPFESDFVLERPLAPEQLTECDRLLAAVIDRAPMPADLSIPSFRAGYLARPGALGTRDGAWLLQVERRPHDAVLDRFPWSWGWIKLPWMPEPLRVDW